MSAPRIMDLVAEAGIDVSDWYDTTGAPSANPKFCYQWAWQQGDVVLITVWHEDLKEGDPITFSGEYRSDWIWEKVQWPARAERVDKALGYAYHRSLPVRVMVVHEEGNRKFRLLDQFEWSVTSFDDDSGKFVLGRTAPRRFIDQFDQNVLQPAKFNGVTTSYHRDAYMRRSVLARAKGYCEHCGERGFETTGGYLYLETHHIRPLCQGGADHYSNMVALCANCHRKAHYAADRDDRVNQLMLSASKTEA